MITMKSSKRKKNSVENIKNVINEWNDLLLKKKIKPNHTSKNINEKINKNRFGFKKYFSWRNEYDFPKYK